MFAITSCSQITLVNGFFDPHSVTRERHADLKVQTLIHNHCPEAVCNGVGGSAERELKDGNAQKRPLRRSWRYDGLAPS